MVEFPIRPHKPSGFDQWQARSYLIASDLGTLTIYGWVYRSLGVHLDSERRKRGVALPGSRSWRITHINSGHSIAHIKTDDFRALMSEATKIADLADWSFLGLDSWKNQEPELREKHLAWLANLPPSLIEIEPKNINHQDQARAIAIAQGN